MFLINQHSNLVLELDETENYQNGREDFFSRLKKLQNNKITLDYDDYDEVKDYQNCGGKRSADFDRNSGEDYVIEKGIVDECCLKECLYEDLMSYCE